MGVDLIKSRYLCNIWVDMPDGSGYEADPTTGLPVTGGELPIGAGVPGNPSGPAPVTGPVPGVTPGYNPTEPLPPVGGGTGAGNKPVEPVKPNKPIGDGRIQGHFYSDDGVDLGDAQTSFLLGYYPGTSEQYLIMYFPKAPAGYKYYDDLEKAYSEYEWDQPAYPSLSQTQGKGKGGVVPVKGGTSGAVSGLGGESTDDINVLKAQIKNLEATIQGMMGDRTGAGYPARSERLVLHHNKPESMVEAALRRGLNLQYYDVNALKRMDEGVIAWITEQTGLEPREVKQYLGGILGAGASALTMVLSGGNFPLGAMAYFAGQGVTQIALNRSSDTPLPSQKALFQGIGGEGSIDGNYINSLDVTLPAGLPHEIFGGYRFVCYDKIQKAWMPSDTIYPIQYWSDEPYRYLCLDRVKQRVYHADSIIKPKIYI